MLKLVEAQTEKSLHESTLPVILQTSIYNIIKTTIFNYEFNLFDSFKLIHLHRSSTKKTIQEFILVTLKLFIFLTNVLIIIWSKL